MLKMAPRSRFVEFTVVAGRAKGDIEPVVGADGDAAGPEAGADLAGRQPGTS